MAPVSLPDVEVLTFDLYGTIVDMQQGLVETITPFLAARGYTGSPSAVVTWWRRTHYQDSMIDALIDGGHTPYREIGRRALSYTLTRAGVPFTDDDARELVAAIERLQPFPDVACVFCGKLAGEVVAVELLGHCRRCTAACEGIEYDIALVGARLDDAAQ